MMKRLIDLILSSIGLLVLLPLFLAVSVWVRIDSKGPIFFRQVRVGRAEVRFKIYKFRTMRHDPAAALNGLQITVGHDARVTKAGRFLRASKLDELPQLWNVLIGDMSLVGPRPEVPYYIEKYPVGIKEKILSVRPGITDLASIEFRHESDLLAQAKIPEKTYIEEILPRKLQLALKYAENPNLKRDWCILWHTARVIFKKSK
jgi:lipopolysaccharide/colanic/teichoic acid biosynthesis glycosyltransferase